MSNTKSHDVGVEAIFDADERELAKVGKKSVLRVRSFTSFLFGLATDSTPAQLRFLECIGLLLLVDDYLGGLVQVRYSQLIGSNGI